MVIGVLGNKEIKDGFKVIDRVRHKTDKIFVTSGLRLEVNDLEHKMLNLWSSGVLIDNCYTFSQHITQIRVKKMWLLLIPTKNY